VVGYEEEDPLKVEVFRDHGDLKSLDTEYIEVSVGNMPTFLFMICIKVFYEMKKEIWQHMLLRRR
jgi:hypothetical protein